jgi:hypothetical protein
MSKNRFAFSLGLDVVAALCLFGIAYIGFHAVPAANASVFASPTPATNASAEPQQYPVMDKIADKLIAKYQTATCEQLWLDKSKKPAPKTQEQQEVVQLLRDDAQMRAYFLGKVAPPIANKMFECGMIP